MMTDFFFLLVWWGGMFGCPDEWGLWKSVFWPWSVAKIIVGLLTCGLPK